MKAERVKAGSGGLGAGERLPDFLIVGAMKAGTTSLYRDLLTQRPIYLPLDKEPHCLVDDLVLSAAGRRDYAAHFRRVRRGQICGEASTGYTKAPDVSGVPERAWRVLGPDLRVIYLVREPIARVRSHHFHEYSLGRAAASIDEAAGSTPALINYTRYAWQISPWIERFGRSNVRIIEFGEYTQDRGATVAALCAWLGVPFKPGTINQDDIFNRGDGKPIERGLRGRLNRSRVYRVLLRPFLPAGVRNSLRLMVLPKAPERPPAPLEATVQRIWDDLEDDLEALRGIMGRERPIWERPVATGGHGPVRGAEVSASGPVAGGAG